MSAARHAAREWHFAHVRGRVGRQGNSDQLRGTRGADTPILDQLRSAHGQEFLDSFRTPPGHTAGAEEQASVLVFLNSNAASNVTGQVVWVDGGSIGETDLAGSVTRR